MSGQEYQVGDLIRPKVDYVLSTGITLGEYLKKEYKVDLDLPFEVVKKYNVLYSLKQGVIQLGVWELRVNYWEKIPTIVDLDEDDDECI